MDNYGTTGADTSHMAGRQNQAQPPRPPEMTHNNQGQLPHMFGNFSSNPTTGYPQINMPVHMQPHMRQQPNPGLPGLQRQFPPAPYPSPPGAPPISTHPGAFPPGRPRDWETPDQRAAIERESKRARPYQPGPSDPPYTNQQPGAFTRNPPMRMPPQHPGQPPSGLAPPGPIPRMPPTNAPAIHPPSHPFAGRGSFAPPINMPSRGPLVQQRENFQFPPKPAAQFQNQPSVQPSASFDSLPAPPRKDFQAASARNKGAGADPDRASEKSESKGNTGPMLFKDFLLKEPDTISPQDAKEKYDLYVREFTKEKPNTFFNIHRHEEWFKERYDPDYVLDRAERIKEEVKARAQDFKELWDNGGSAVCAPDISSACLDGKQGDAIHHNRSSTPEVKTKEGCKLENADASKQSQADVAKLESLKEEENASKKDGADETQMKVAPANAEGHELSSKQRGKEEPQDEDIKTEDVTNDAEAEATVPHDEGNKPVEAEDGAIPSDMKPESSVVKGEPSDINISAVAEARKGKDEKTTSSVEPGNAIDRQPRGDLLLPLRREHQKHTIFMRGIPINLNRNDLTKVLEHGSDGGMDLQLRRLKIGDINPMRGLERFAWAVYATEEAAAVAIEKVRGFVVRSKSNAPEEDGKGVTSTSDDEEEPTCVYEIDCMLNLQRKKRYTQGRILPPAFGTPDRMRHDVTQSVKMVRYLDKLREVDETVNPLSDEFLKQLPSDGSRLDHIVTYLREVHYFCYYSGNEFLEDATSMPPQELRPSGERVSRPMNDNDFRVVKRVDERAKWVLERDYDRPRSNSDSAGATQKNAVQKWLDDYTRHEGQGRFRCDLPPYKLFKAPEFVHKHMRTKHDDKVKSIMEKTYTKIYRANFENDPSKEEVISIYNDGVASAQQKSTGGRQEGKPQVRPSQQFGFPQGRPNAPMGMYNPTGGFMGMGMQHFPMMVMPPAPGYPPAYPAASGYPNSVALAGRGVGGMGGRGMTPSGMLPMGMQGVDGGSSQGRPNQRNRESSRDFRDGGYREGGYRGGYRGGRRGGYVRRGGDHFRRGHGDGRPLDPRASGPRRTYNDLDAPANGPSFDLVRYDDV